MSLPASQDCQIRIILPIRIRNWLGPDVLDINHDKNRFSNKMGGLIRSEIDLNLAEDRKDRHRDNNELYKRSVGHSEMMKPPTTMKAPPSSKVVVGFCPNA